VTPERFHDCLEILGLGNHHFVSWLNIRDRLVRRWRSGDREIPPEVEVWLEGLVAWWLEHPPPTKYGFIPPSPHPHRNGSPDVAGR